MKEPNYKGTQVEYLIESGFDKTTNHRVACSRCEAMVINGIPTHEIGCPNTKHECKGCGALVLRGVTYCVDCQFIPAPDGETEWC